MRAASGSAANRARTAGGWSPGRLRGSGRSTAVRVPSGYMSTWAPTQASSVSPPVRRRGAAQAAQPAPGAASGRRPGVPDSGCRTRVVRLRARPRSSRSLSHRRRRGFRPRRCTAMCSVHRTVMRPCVGFHTVRCRRARSSPVRDRTPAVSDRMSGDHGHRLTTHTRRPKGEPCPATPVPGGRPTDRADRSPRLGRAAGRVGARLGRATPRPRAHRATRRAHAAGDGLVVGTMPLVARVDRGAAHPGRRRGRRGLLPDLPRGGRPGTRPRVTGFGGALVALLVPAAHLRGRRRSCVRGRVPKFGLAYAGVAGALAVGQLLIEIYRGSSSTTRPARRGDRRVSGC